MKPRGSITGPLILIAVGVIFLAHAISPDFPLGDWLSRYWPYLLIAWGVVSLIEVSVRFLSGSPTGTLPANGVSSGAWLVIALICLLGVGAYEVRRPGAWWRQAGFERGMQAFGEEHEYSIDPLRRDVGVKPHIVLESFRGDAKIIGSAGTELVVGGHKTVRSFQKHDADTANSRTPVEIVVEGNTVIIRAHQDRADSHSGVTTNLELSVPKGASLDATGTLGDFDITSLAGDIDVSSGNAGVRLEDVGGNVKVETRKSDLIRCTNVKGSVDLRGRGSDVELSKIEGLVTISADYTGTVALRELTKPVRVKSLRTQIDAEGVPGEIRLDRGSLNAQNLIGPIKVVAHSTDVTLKGFTQELDLNVDRGDVELSPRSVPLGHIAVHARSGNIEIALPESAKFALNATTENGEIDNQFGDVLKETTSGRGGRLEGSIGSGPDVSLVTQHGSITLRKASGDAAANTAFRNGSGQPNKNSDPLAALLLSTLRSARR
jgi:DUF4097 and DUF4098 domain-containing protein YvlB